MNDIRLAWEPEGLAPSALVSHQVSKYMENKATFAQFENGTCLMLKPVPNLDEAVQGSLREAKYLPDFKVYQMEDGDFLVFFANPLLVYVGKEEFVEREPELRRRLDDLKFPGEALATPQGMPETHMLVGLYARGKLQRDTGDPQRYAVIAPQPA
jgi:hypothetical protein